MHTYAARGFLVSGSFSVAQVRDGNERIGFSGIWTIKTISYPWNRTSKILAYEMICSMCESFFPETPDVRKSLAGFIAILRKKEIKDSFKELHIWISIFWKKMNLLDKRAKVCFLRSKERIPERHFREKHREVGMNYRKHTQRGVDVRPDR